ncbi:MAG: carbohydrate porin [Okeania sp. SIO2H7]|nr:carbohydrate porin [Okeania sp. SIO2H7]
MTYIRYYNNILGSGSNAANIAEPEALLRATGIDGAVNVNGDAFGLAFSWLLSDTFALGGWVGYTKQNVLASVGDNDEGEQDIWNWAVTLAFPDLLKEGSTGGIIVGMEPWVTDATNGLPEDSETSLHVEAFYELALNDNIAITPAFIWITNPNNMEDDEDLFIGVIRTTFSF